MTAIKDEGRVVTVTGTIGPEDVGVCSTHEHLLFDFSGAYWQEPEGEADVALAHGPILLENRGLLQRNPFVIKENLWHDSVSTAVAELGHFARAGGQTVVEVTPIGQGRDPLGLRRISERSGVHVIATSSYYIETGHPGFVSEKTIDELASILIAEIDEGIDGTDVRAGFMGDVGTTKSVTKNEEKTLRAVARAHLATGAAMGIHVDPSDRQGMRALSILFDEGVRPERIVLEHMDEQPHEDYHLEIAATGVTLEFDTWGSEFYYGPPYCVPEPRDIERARCVASLVKHGHVGQVVLAQDVWLKQLMKKYGGEGYDSLFRYGLPRLREAGVSEADIRTMLVENPRKVLPLAV